MAPVFVGRAAVTTLSAAVGKAGTDDVGVSTPCVGEWSGFVVPLKRVVDRFEEGAVVLGEDSGDVCELDAEELGFGATVEDPDAVGRVVDEV